MNKKVEKRKAIGKQPLGTYNFAPEEVVDNYDWRIKMTYIPKIGDAVAARRKIKSKIYHNLLVGPIYDTSENSCVMVNERGTERETKWTLFYSDWDFEYLFPDEPVITTHNSE